MKNVFSALLLSVIVSSQGFAGPKTVTAVIKLQNVVDNSIPNAQGSTLSDKVAELKEDIERLNSSLQKVENLTKNSLTKQYQSPVLAKLSELKTALAQELSSGIETEVSQNPKGKFVCSAGCTDSWGAIDLKSLSLGYGESQLFAKDAATKELKKAYNCTYSGKINSCVETSSNSKAVTCQTACTDSWGVPDMNYSTVAQGSTRLEAEANAHKAVHALYKCTYGQKLVTCE